jgi:ABC-type spermidine/putrescine transport system permease subunit I
MTSVLTWGIITLLIIFLILLFLHFTRKPGAGESHVFMGAMTLMILGFPLLAVFIISRLNINFQSQTTVLAAIVVLFMCVVLSYKIVYWLANNFDKNRSN